MHLTGNSTINFVLRVALLCINLTGCKGQPETGSGILKLEKSILMPDVKGRIDHIDINLKGQVVYVAALGNNSLEAIDLKQGRIVHSIKGLDEPQGIGYIPQHEEIFVANGGNGDCYFYNANSFEKVAAIHLSSDADDVRYDSVERKIYVGYGDGGIAVIDADAHNQVGDVKLPAHPESFQIDKKLNSIFVNLPDAHMVAEVDLSQLKITNKWTRNSPTANFPMALDTGQHRVFIGYRHPPRLIVLNGETGAELYNLPMAGDADDLYYDTGKKRVLVSGGDGHLVIYQEQANSGYQTIAEISTSKGARTSLFVPGSGLFIVAARATSGMPAKMLVYKIIQ